MGLYVGVSWLEIPKGIKRIAIPGVMLTDQSLPYFEQLQNIPFVDFVINVPSDMRGYKYVYALPIQVPNVKYEWYKAYTFEITTETFNFEGYRQVQRNEYNARVFEIEIPRITIQKATLTNGEPDAIVFTRSERKLLDIESSDLLLKKKGYWSLASFDNPDKGFILALLKGKSAKAKLIYKDGSKWNINIFHNGEEISYSSLD